ncbi:zinc finger CCCH domain-containing protein 37-like [Populus alba x Populus x berolinensis]|uniref:Zinc finger CCCH domain-containing protein 37-like n=2 Tax=Populus TaxID=3689 RepID=A0A4U5QBF5_POPAL|nr:zinc finger CCCH domain-containing protein 37-like [Populus alba]KAJ6909941.1 zinc finger CCCH domain-containing protein 37-like [Populus alba x Populus x berolinensis]KAJ6987454.1 zinc finger CCCH domain-containing protein 37-like [Populus alba x Populus x berolinensis]TKS07603.1 zinc finger CCCH domain-containing protein 37-like [Populus alba]
MAKQLYGYGAPATTSASRSRTDSYLTDSVLTRYLGTRSDPLSSDSSKYSASSSMYLTQSDSALRYSVDRGIASAAAAATSPHLSSWPPPPGVDAPSAVDSLVPGLKRTPEVLYHPTLLGAHSTIGQSEDWYSTNALAKRARFETTSHLPIYPQRPGEKDCAYYMLTRTCKFGDTCKFDHPVWVPEGGIPDWKEVPPIATSETFPDRPGVPDCPYFLKTQRCKYGVNCKFNHPKEKLSLGVSENTSVSALPERPSEPPCAFYMKTGICKFGATCKFHHPKDIQISLAGQGNDNGVQTNSVVDNGGITGDVNVIKALVSVTPALLHNSKGLPMRPGEVDCPFYLKTGSCKYGATCRYNHPERTAINPPAAAISHAIIAPSMANLNLGVFSPAASIYQTIDPRLSTLGVGPTVYPQRPGQAECDFYMKTGECKFGETCKFHHPIDRSAPTANQTEPQTVKLTLAGLPRREGAVHCPYYMKTGTCKYGATCKFDHPPPGEVMVFPNLKELLMQKQ